jgi:hypothetical protein
MRPSFTSVRPGLLQRQCACESAAVPCADCEKKRKVQRSASSSAPVTAVPGVVHRALGAPGVPLDGTTRGFMESRFGHSFARVRVHHDSVADESARAVHANAYTVGRDIVFASGRYEPHTAKGRQLLAHELAHVMQQGEDIAPTSELRLAPRSSPEEAEAEAAAATATRPRRVARDVDRASPHAGALQRQDAGDEKKPETPAAAMPKFELHLDPAIQAQAFALQTQSLLDPARVRLSLFQLDYDSLLGSAPPPGLTAPSLPTASDPVPRGAGPETPRAAGAGDVLKALMKVPAVDRTLTTLQTEAIGRLKADWRSLQGGEKVAVITHSALIAGGALAGVISNPASRQLALDVLQDRTLPTGVPGLQFQFNLTGPDQRIKFDLNLGQFLPKTWGFH